MQVWCCGSCEEAIHSYTLLCSRHWQAAAAVAAADDRKGAVNSCKLPLLSHKHHCQPTALLTSI